MKQRFRHLRLWLPLITGGLLLGWTVALAGAGRLEASSIPAEVHQAIASNGTARVILLLESERAPGADSIRRTQARVLDQLQPHGFELGHRYQTVPAISGRIGAGGLETLAATGGIAAVQLDRPGGGHLGQSVPALAADVVHDDYGLSGAGVTVAVLDSGVDTDHPDIADDLVAQKCFTDSNCPPYGHNTGISAEDEQGHGTNVASIITSRGAVAAPGFAPDADITAVRVLDENNSGWVSDWIAGLDWVLANQATLDVQIINMSLGTWALYSGNCDAQEPVLAEVIAQLRAAGVTIFASSGNQGKGNAMAAPACNSGVIAVGATYDGGLGREPDQDDYQDWFGRYWPACYDAVTSVQTIACFGNSGEMLDLLAPGARITGAGLYGQRWTFVGTSQAAPTAAGIAALMLEANEHLSPVIIEELLKAGGQPLRDPRNGRTITAVNALEALRPLLPVTPAELALAGPADISTGFPTLFTATVRPLSSTQPLLYHWQATGQPDLIQAGTLSNTARFTWTEPGTYTVHVTATNKGGEVAASQALTVVEVALADVEITGEAKAATGAPYRLRAAARPVTASWPITYHWQATGQPAREHQGGAGDEVTFTWPQAGWYTVALEASNKMGAISHTRMVQVGAFAPESVDLVGPAQGATGFTYSATATIAPDLVSLPLTYTWGASEQPTQTIVGAEQATATFSWTEAGEKEIWVRVENEAGAAEARWTVIIWEIRPQVLLPRIMLAAAPK